MSEEQATLEMIREVAKSRIELLKKGITFHDENSRLFYLREYENKLRRIEELIRRTKIRIVRREQADPDPEDDDSSI
jgi:hypothetical protein